MALIFMGGWESGTNLDTFTSVTRGAGSGVVTTYRRGAQYSMCFTNNTDCAYYNFSDIEPELFVQVAIIFTERSNIGDYAGPLLKLMRDDAVFAVLKINSSGGVSAYWGDGVLRTVYWADGIFLVGSSSTPFVQNRWYDLEVRVKVNQEVDPTNYVFEVKVDGVTVISYSENPSIFQALVNAHWQFEEGALTTDSVGSNTLTVVGSPVANTEDFTQGAACLDLEYSTTDYLRITDAALDSGFPLKDGDTTKCFTYCFWMNQESQAVNPCYVIAKYGSENGDRSFAILVSSNTLHCYWGYNSGNTAYTWSSSISIVNGEWYHVGIAVDGIAQIMRLRVYRVSTGTTTSITSSTMPQELWVGDGEFRVGARGNDALYRFDGKIDDLVVCSGFLTDSLIDAIRQHSVAGLTSTTLGMNAIEVDSPTNYTLYVDDVVINDATGDSNNSWPDNVHVLALNPRSDVTSEWTVAPYAPSNWEQAQLFGASQISTSVADAVEMYGLEPKPIGINSVAAVQSLISARAHVSTPAITTLRSLIKVGSTVFESTDFTISSVYIPYFYTWETNPLTGTTWTVEDLDNLKIGVKSIR